MYETIKTFLSKFIQGICSFPCPGCHKTTPGSKANALCPECFKKLPFIKEPFCPGCGGELDGVLELCRKCLKEDKRPWKKAFSVLEMNGTAQELLHQFKYQNHPEMARTLGRLASEKLTQNEIKADLIVPTPLHWTRIFMRGFNQSALLSEIISEESKIPLNHLLARVKRTKQQATLSREERKTNLRGAFSVKKQEICKNRTILLVDDVITTGSTLTAATETLLKAGAREVYVLTIARR